MRIIVYKIPSTEKVLYNLGILLEKLCLAKKRIGIFCDEENIAVIDKTLWTFSTNYFVPHEISLNDAVENERSKMFSNEIQPVLLATSLQDLYDREILCVFNDIDFEKSISYLKDNKNTIKYGIKDIIYIVNDNNVNMAKIKDLINSNDIDSEKNTLDIYVKNGLKWEKE